MTSKQPIPSVWTRQNREREQPALSRGQIVAEAVRLLDAEGVEALSMRRLGARLNAGATSLYRHVANRDELIELVVDEVYGEIEVPEAAGGEGWREAVATCAHSVRAMILRHPWTASVLGQVGLSYLGPHVMRLNDRMLALFEAAGFPLAEADQALSSVFAYVIGMGISEAAWLAMVARSGQDEQEWQENLRPTAERAAQPYERLHEQFVSQQAQHPRQARDEKFHYGLERLLDGLSARLARVESAGG
ncbi:TetR/AcrR family transcriptional regulator [Streptoalloteichus hindustanus]|uniref:Transcriptional regulator, TetR family n=1 Tax=Streptoalloteichus hindustanus TaxID=2017 RepID=A0A1M5FRF5_STRHI|nr:TetR/AcrR family transcriptional regulator [Streptoalloteichus hindustanus]SHF93752.1 transcriptional regulator, TetR family [Streptoalloteichus hindustanus]